MANAIQFWISQGSNRLRLPVNPESVAVNSPYDFEDIKVARLGERTVIGERGLREVSFQSFFPRDYNATYCEYLGFPKPQQCVALIEKFRDNRKPCRITVTGTQINYTATIREFEVLPEKAGSPGDIYFTISFKEWREVVKVSAASTTKSRASSNTKLKTYTVKSGDSLYKIAARSDVYGNGAKWNVIYDANKKTIGKNPQMIKPGQKLVIP